jgi:hypothetical protein
MQILKNKNKLVYYDKKIQELNVKYLTQEQIVEFVQAFFIFAAN